MSLATAVNETKFSMAWVRSNGHEELKTLGSLLPKLQRLGFLDRIGNRRLNFCHAATSALPV